MTRSVPLLLAGVVAMALSESSLLAEEKAPKQQATFGSIERLDPRINDLIAPGARLEVLAEGFEWTEGPVWVADGGYLLFSDTRTNKVWKWKEGEGTSVYLEPSGYTGTKENHSEEPGSNGLSLDKQGRLVLCQHGDRRVARWTKKGGFETLADEYRGGRLNSPNDAVWKSDGSLYFTDPPYGLPTRDPADGEIGFCGVYRLSPDGKLTLLTKEMTRPNGIAFSPDEKTLYVAQSDPKAAIWKAFDVKEDGTISGGRVFFDAPKWVGKKKGLPDGFKVDARGNLFASGPGGILVFSPDGDHLGTIHTGQATSNCAFGDDGRTLYITADMYLLRLPLKTQGPGF
jgi:gluconolactonase